MLTEAFQSNLTLFESYFDVRTRVVIAITRPCNITVIFLGCKNLNFQMKKNVTFVFIFAQNIDRGYTLEAVLTSSHNLCLRAKIRKMYTLVNPSFTI